MNILVRPHSIPVDTETGDFATNIQLTDTIVDSSGDILGLVSDLYELHPVRNKQDTYLAYSSQLQSCILVCPSGVRSIYNPLSYLEYFEMFLRVFRVASPLIAGIRILSTTAPVYSRYNPFFNLDLKEGDFDRPIVIYEQQKPPSFLYPPNTLFISVFRVNDVRLDNSGLNIKYVRAQEATSLKLLEVEYDFEVPEEESTAVPGLRLVDPADVRLSNSTMYRKGSPVVDLNSLPKHSRVCIIDSSESYTHLGFMLGFGIFDYIFISNKSKFQSNLSACQNHFDDVIHEDEVNINANKLFLMSKFNIDHDLTQYEYKKLLVLVVSPLSYTFNSIVSNRLEVQFTQEQLESLGDYGSIILELRANQLPYTYIDYRARQYFYESHPDLQNVLNLINGLR